MQSKALQDSFMVIHFLASPTLHPREVRPLFVSFANRNVCILVDKYSN